MRLDDGTLAGFEALLRWNHPVRGLLPPADFLAHAEETGLVIALGRFAVEQAASDLAQWQKYFPLEPPLFASVNLSRRQLLDRNLEDLFRGLVGPGGARRGTLKLELTESAISSVGDIGSVLTRIVEAGIGLSIDDFGTGMSSLSQLRLMPFDTVKIDKGLLVRSDDAAEKAKSEAISRSIVNLAHELGHSVVFEGVETASDAKWLKDIGCEFAQGFYFSPPLAQTEVLKFIARNHRDLGEPILPPKKSGPARMRRKN
jgi:EAL domain-containing protein (putative c-di-GMP-specific phosphodiesterase class I)